MLFSIPRLSDKTVAFLTECTYGDTWREVKHLPRRYAWLKTLMRLEGTQVAKELYEHGLATSSTDGRVFVNMSRLPELVDLLELLER